MLAGGRAAPAGVELRRSCDGDRYSFILENKSRTDQCIKEVVLFDGEHSLPAESRFHGEGYNKISQMTGTLGQPEDVDPYTDRELYKLPEPAGFRTVYGMMSTTAPDGQCIVLGFTSCRRFVGKFNVNRERLQVVIQTEGLPLRAGESWNLEELVILSGKDRNELLKQLAARICEHHPRLPFPALPTGWCSWYCYGPDVTPALIRENLTLFKAHAPEVRYVQVDDGYQPWMGDWLEPSERFPEGIGSLMREIRGLGFEAAIWVAPFIASPESSLFQKHPDWFVKDEHGTPLQSDAVTFGGWRQGPWYMLDGTHPATQNYLEKVFRTMREEWGCTYFKLDANIWGALPFGKRHDPDATSVEAYRRGMAAVRRGAGPAFLLGCNHPLWPSLGEIHGGRNSMDIARSWSMVKRVARENLLRNWQNTRLWWNDPDCVLLDLPDLSEDEKLFHWTATYASGGMVLSGDAVRSYRKEDWTRFRKMISSPGVAAEFEDDQLTVGQINQGNIKLAVALNWSEDPEPRHIPLAGHMRVIDFWTGADLGIHNNVYAIEHMPPHSGRLFRVAPAKE